MQPSQVREKVLGDHETLRVRLDEIENLARSLRDGKTQDSTDLRLRGLEFLDRLETHMHWEDLYLLPALRGADAWGPERASQFEEEHREQREVLRLELEAISDGDRPASLVAKGMLDLVTLLRDDMVEEESFFLDPDVLRDDVIGIDVEAG